MSVRDKLFIGHANPEDNEFTLWLHSKLTNEGYNAICDLTYLTGGEQDYWKSLQEVLEKECIKYLLVFSQSTFDKSGVIDEWEQVRGFYKKYELNDFIYILKIDNVPFDKRIGTKVINQFRFENSWALGLKKLLFRLHEDNIPKFNYNKLSINDWLKNKYSTFSGVQTKTEIFYSNWLKISNYPEKIYFHQFFTRRQAEEINKQNCKYPSIQHDVYVISFLENLPVYLDSLGFEIKFKTSFSVKSTEVFLINNREEFPKINDLKRFFVRLLNDAFQKFMKNRAIEFYLLSQNRKCYYYKLDQLINNKASFNYEDKKKRKQLVGEYFDSYWHFGISVNVLLKPILVFSLKSHIIFSDEGKEIWDSKNKLHRARRSKGKSFYNKEWRNLLLAFLSSLSDDEEVITIALNENMNLGVKNTTIKFTCDLGYDEPLNQGRLVPIDYYDDIFKDEMEIESEYSLIEEIKVEDNKI